MKRRKQIIAYLMAVTMAVTPMISGIGVYAAPQQAQAQAEEALYENAASASFEGLDFSGLTKEVWDGIEEYEYAQTAGDNLTLSSDYKESAVITLDQDAYDSLSEAGSYLKVQAITKTGSDWIWVQADGEAAVGQSDFTDNGDGTYSAALEFSFTGKGGDTLSNIEYRFVGIGFVGNVTVSDVKIINLSSDTEEEPDLVDTDPAVLADFESEDQMGNWAPEAGYAYSHGSADTTSAEPEIAYDATGEQLKVTLNYTANSDSTWSEAKIKYTSPEGADISNYNQIGADLILPVGVTSVGKLKFYGESEDGSALINSDQSIDLSEAVDLGNGYQRVTVTFNLTPNSAALKYLTVGFVGVGSDFAGDIYLDNVILSQKDTSGDFVEITETPKSAAEAAQVDVSSAAFSVNAADTDLNEAATALLAYLQGVSDSDQVIFGHQYDTSRSVNTSASLGDVEDVTGSVAGMYGLDTLGLIGSELGGSTQEEAMANAVSESVKAAQNGALITLSSHMPNFTNDSIIKNEDGTYDFSNCDFAESKDVSGDSIKTILPGGENNEIFNAYLDLIAEYALEMDAYGIPVIFRPFHENTGSWFWWGSTNTAETYKSLYRYAWDYMTEQGVHNMVYVFSPGGPISSEEEYLATYPGDEYVDILAFDYYDDYSYGSVSDGSFYSGLNLTCQVVSSIAETRGKLAAISECGVRVTKKDGSDSEGLLITNNPIGTETAGTNWYQEVSDIAKNNNMPYFLVWANFSDTNFYVPYKSDETHGQELINDFISFYNNDSTIFGNGTNFYENVSTLAGTAKHTYDNATGYFVSNFDNDTILEVATLEGFVENGSEVSFVVTNTETKDTVTLKAVKGEANGRAYSYTADLTEEDLKTIGKTEVGKIQLVADGEVVAEIENLAIGAERAAADSNVLEDFDFYSGSQSLLNSAYSNNGAAGCSSELILDADNKANGFYGGAFHYTLAGKDVYTGKIRQENADLSEYNAISMWVKPDGLGQKMIIQIADGSGEEFEVSLQEFVEGTEARYVTIPFASFKGKQGGTLDPSTISKLAFYCNSLPSGESVNIDSTIYFDAICGVTVSDEDLAKADSYGLIITEDAIGGEDSEEEQIETVKLYRIYNPKSGEHLYTTDAREQKYLVSKGWHDEGYMDAVETSDVPVYRVYNPKSGEHHYTSDKVERSYLTKHGWKDEGIAFYSADRESGVPVYRLYKAGKGIGNHHYTVSKTEKNYLTRHGWSDEGIGWYVAG